MDLSFIGRQERDRERIQRLEYIVDKEMLLYIACSSAYKCIVNLVFIVFGNIGIANEIPSNVPDACQRNDSHSQLFNTIDDYPLNSIVTLADRLTDDINNNDVENTIINKQNNNKHQQQFLGSTSNDKVSIYTTHVCASCIHGYFLFLLPFCSSLHFFGFVLLRMFFFIVDILRRRTIYDKLRKNEEEITEFAIHIVIAASAVVVVVVVVFFVIVEINDNFNQYL
jgi:hypothetical protein